VENDGRFMVAGNELKVANGVMFDYEQAKQYSVKLVAVDNKGAVSQSQTFNIAVGDLPREVMAAANASPLNDIIKGSKTLNAKDVFNGGLGDDKLWGGYANDTLWGGAGKDVFVFDGKLGTS
jgi:hypothetical protein